MDVSRGVGVLTEVCAADGVFVFTGCGKRVAVGIEVASRVTVGTGAGAKSRFAAGSPKTAVAPAITANTSDVTSHCQPFTVRVRRVR